MTISDVTGLLTAAGVFITALAGFRNIKKTGQVHDAVDEVHTAVTSTSDAQPR